MESSQTGALPTRTETELAEPYPHPGRDRPSQLHSRHDKLIRLGDFQEATGQLLAIDEGDEMVSIVLSVGTLQYPSHSREAGICLEAFDGAIGKRVSILRTPSRTNPIRVHTAEVAA